MFQLYFKKILNTVCYMQLLNIQIYTKNKYYVLLNLLKLFTANIVDLLWDFSNNQNITFHILMY